MWLRVRSFTSSHPTIPHASHTTPVHTFLHEGGAPEILSVILEGESLFNDASSLTLFEVRRSTRIVWYVLR